MTGAKNFVGTEDSLTFEVGSNPKHVSHVRVTQTPDDLYAVTFFRRGKAPQIMDGTCCDILQELFTDNTGLYIRPDSAATPRLHLNDFRHFTKT